MQQPKETLTFRLGLSGTYWGRVPVFSVLLNDDKHASGPILKPSGEVQYIEFTADLDEDKTHTLQIRLENKTSLDTVIDSDGVTIAKDMLLNIDSIEIDNIDMGQLKWGASRFVPDDSTRPTLDSCVNLGWNGAYTLTFSSPFYLWLLENM